MILDVRVPRGATPDAVIDVVARHMTGEVGVDRYGNPAIRTATGMIVAAHSLWDIGQVYAEVRSRDDARANHVYDILVHNTTWDVSLVDSCDNNPEDIILRHRITSAA